MINFKGVALASFFMFSSASTLASTVALTGSYPLTVNDSPAHGYELATQNAIDSIKDDLKNSDIFTTSITESEKTLILYATPFVTFKQVTSSLVESCPESQYGCAVVNVTVNYDLSKIKNYIKQMTLNSNLKAQVHNLALKELKEIDNAQSQTDKASAYVKLEALINASGDNESQSFMINDSYKMAKIAAKENVESARDIRKKYDDYTFKKRLYSELQKPFTEQQKKEYKKLCLLAMESAKPEYKIRSITFNRMTDNAVIFKISTYPLNNNHTTLDLLSRAIGIYVPWSSVKYTSVGNTSLSSLPNVVSPTSYYAHGYKGGEIIHFVDDNHPRLTPIKGVVLVQNLYYGKQKKPFATYALLGDIKGYEKKLHPTKGFSYEPKNWESLYYKLYYQDGAYIITTEKPDGFAPNKAIPIRAELKIISF